MSEKICPECGNTTSRQYRPFCSKRCADVDLSRWLRGAYAIPTGNVDIDEDGEGRDALEAARRARLVDLRDDEDDGNSGLH